MLSKIGSNSNLQIFILLPYLTRFNFVVQINLLLQLVLQNANSILLFAVNNAKLTAIYEIAFSVQKRL
jgi:hypothetical protein